MLAPNSPLRAAATAYGLDAANDPRACAEVAAPPAALAPNARSPARYLWAVLLARLFESLPLTCPLLRRGHLPAGRRVRIVAFVTEAAPVERILTHTCLPQAGR